MNQKFQFNPMMDQSFMPGIGALLPNPNQLNLYGPYEGFMNGNLFKNLYQPYKNYTPVKITPKSEQEELLLNVDQISFAAHELNLYLDVFPNDRNALDLFNRYRKMTEEAIDIYEKKFGPITLASNTLETSPWAWENVTWPWEKEVN